MMLDFMIQHLFTQRSTYELYYGSFSTSEAGYCPVVEQNANYEKATVFSWNLSSLRSSSPAEAIESASLTLQIYAAANWTDDDDVQISVINTYAQGGYLNESSSSSYHASLVCSYPSRTITNIDVSHTGDSTIDITTLVDYWYLYSNDSMFSILVEPDSGNNAENDKYLCWHDHNPDEPTITINTGDSIMRATGYGSTSGNHGPKVIHDFGCSVTCYNLTIHPYIQEEINKMGIFSLKTWTGDNGTGRVVHEILYYDVWYSATNKFYFKEGDTIRYQLISPDINMYDNWDTFGEDNASIIRDGSNLLFYTNGELRYNDTPSITTAIRSVTIEFQTKNFYTPYTKLGLRAILFQRYSTDYDDDGYSNTEEQTYDGEVWNPYWIEIEERYTDDIYVWVNDYGDVGSIKTWIRYSDDGENWDDWEYLGIDSTSTTMYNGKSTWFYDHDSSPPSDEYAQAKVEYYSGADGSGTLLYTGYSEVLQYDT